MGIWSSVGSIVSSIGSAISSAVSSIGSALSSFASTIAPVIGSIISAIPAIGKTISTIAQGLLQAFGVLKPDEKIEDLGEKAAQAAEAGITFEEFGDFGEYIEKIRNFKIDPEKASKRSSAEKIVAGLAVGTAGLENKLDLERGALNSLWLLPITNSDYFNVDKLVSMVEKGQVDPEIYEYLENNLAASDSRDIEKKMEIGLNESEVDQLYEALDSSRSTYETLAQEVNQKLS